MIPRFFKQLLALSLVASISFLMLRPAKACGPFFTDAIFVYTKHPDFPLERFATGRLGVLRPTYARSYLVAAYRDLIGAPLSSSEAKALQSLWEDRLGNSFDLNEDTWIKKWMTARTSVPGTTQPAEIHVFRNREKPNEYETYLNCQQDAFENAEATLNERIKRFGADSSVVREWLAAQDIVFSNCRAGRQIPENARPDQDALIRADRAYQIAAANFYSGSFDDARQQFDAIGHDDKSPWHVTAGYLAARASLRKGSFAEREEDARPSLTDAETRLNAILKDRRLSPSHHAAARLLNLVRLRLHPEEKLHELSRAIIAKDASPDFKQDVWDYTVLLDKFVGDDTEDSSTKKIVPAGVKSDELSDWILTFQQQTPAAASHALERWQNVHSIPWLVAALSEANGQSASLAELLAAASKIDQNSPAFASVVFHSARLLSESNRSNEARSLLDKVLAGDRQTLPASAINELLAERTQLAQNLREFLRSAQRVPAAFSADDDGREIPEDDKDAESTTNGAKLFFDNDAGSILNRATPTNVLNDAARDASLAPNLRRDIAQAAFVRAALLGDAESAATAATLLASLYPELREQLSAYQRATTPEAKRFAAAYLSLKFPGLRPYVSVGVGRTSAIAEMDSYRDNWWCAGPPIPMSQQGENGGDLENKPFPVPDFLKGSATSASKQLATLRSLGVGPDYLCRTVIDWANKNPTDARVAEALHLAVKSTRYGCSDKETGRWSKAAFDLLHRRYPNTSWAKETKYWFNGQ
jgi:hypothetical protein